MPVNCQATTYHAGERGGYMQASLTDVETRRSNVGAIWAKQFTYSVAGNLAYFSPVRLFRYYHDSKLELYQYDFLIIMIMIMIYNGKK